MVNQTGMEIAVIGLSGRFPQAENVQEFWNNLKDGKNCITAFSDEELLQRGERESLLRLPQYIKFGSYVENKSHFDAAFFNYRPDEATLMDPQTRLFHECCWEALEDSGLANQHTVKEKIGLFASAPVWLNWGVYAALKNAEEQLVDNYSLQELSDVSYMNSMIAYRLNLNGPVMFLHTACSSSLTAIHLACNSLLLGECKVALAGGVTLNNFSNRGYLYHAGQVQSADGRCCPFDHKASGTVFGEGAGVVVLKRLKDALKDGDNIHAVIKGSAINNDGNDKVGYTAPSVSKQAEAIAKAMKNARVEPDSISYIEAHGTGTVLGDPIEIEALNQAFKASGSKRTKYCLLGSVKSNIGHLDAASGVAGFIKVVMSLKNRQLPATLHYEKPNPNINFDDSPFYVCDQLTEWPRSAYPLRAGITSLGIGGTNVHMIVEEAPPKETSSAGRAFQLVTLSGKTAGALKRNAMRLRNHLQQHGNHNLADVAFTLNACRTSFEYRKALVAGNCEDLITALQSFESEEINKDPAHSGKRNKVVFMFPGQGAQYPGMCRELLHHEQTFREETERCLEIVRRHSNRDLRGILFSESTEDINNTAVTQPLLFIIEYALARLLMSWGIQPDVMIGHSIGEYVAACLAGVFTLEDALQLVIKRGELMSTMEPGSMLSISIPEKDLQPYLQQHAAISLAAVNSSTSCVVAGADDAIVAFRELMEHAGVSVKKLNTSHAFHSHMMEDMLADFGQVLSAINIGSQKIPFISNVTGQKAADSDLSNPQYWLDQLRRTVQFSEGVSTLMADEHVLFVEVGPGKSLGSFVGANAKKKKEHSIVNLLGRYKESNDSLSDLLKGVGKLWGYGITPDWNRFYMHETRQRLSLPTYSFEPVPYLADVDTQAMIMETGVGKPVQKDNDLFDWFYAPTWKLASAIRQDDQPQAPVCSLLFADDCGISDAIIERLKHRGDKVVRVRPGLVFEQKANDEYVLPAGQEAGYQQLFGKLAANGLLPDRIIHCWGITNDDTGNDPATEQFDLSFYSLLSAVKTSQKQKSALREVTVLTSGLHNVMAQPVYSAPHRALAIGLLKVVGQEYPTVTTAHIDISLREAVDPSYQSQLFTEILHPRPGKIISLRNANRWALIYDKVEFRPALSAPAFKAGGVYLITGGLGGFGYTISKYLSKHYKAKMILLGRQPLPAASDWEHYLNDEPSDKDTVERIKRIKALEQEGGEVVYLDANMDDPGRFSTVLKFAEERVGSINGVFHAAGVMNGRSINSIDQLNRTDFELQFSSKVRGLMVLYETLKDRELDFCIVTSSLAAVLGGLGFGAYSPANVFMDYFIQANRTNGSLRNWVSINFDGISYDGSSYDLINSHELPEVVNRAIALKELPQLVVSATALQPRLDDWVNKKNLVLPSQEAAGAHDVSEPGFTANTPATIEKKLMKLWANFFGRADFGMDDDFFEIGGDSLMALTLIARINREFNADISLSVFFKAPFIRSLAVYLSGTREAGSLPVVNNAIKKAPEKEYYQLSPSQRRLYFLYEFDKASLAYNMPAVFDITGDLDMDRLTDAFQKLVSRHESLRTSFLVVEGQVVQKVSENVAFAISQTEWLHDEADELINQFIRPFDLGTAPLLRVSVVKKPAGKYLLLVDMHHIITDGVSISLLIKDFVALYNNEALRELRLQYKDYSEWQQGPEQQVRLAAQRDFWQQQFIDEVNALDLPADYPRPKIKSYKGSHLSFALDRETTKQLRTIGDQTGATLFMTLLSVLNVLLSKLSNQEDITVGTGIAGRYHQDLEGIIGMFVNTLALRNYPTQDKSFRQFLLEVKTNALSCFDNQLYPYEELINTLQIPRDPGRNPLFDVVLTFQNFQQDTLSMPGLTLQPHDKQVRRISKFDMELAVVELNEELHLDMEYSTDLFKPQTIQRFIAYFRQIIQEVIADVDIKLSQIDILTPSERHELLHTFNDTVAEYPKNRTVIDLFEEQVNKTPQQVAVKYLSRQLSYQQLDELSARLARRLRGLGVKQGELVGILQEPSELLLVSIVGVLKAGATFVPIDKDYPKSRKKHIVSHSGLSVLLSDALLLADNRYISEVLPSDRLLDIASLVFDTPDTTLDLPDVSPNHLAYVLYTSGSTGLPKGVMISHGSLFNYLSWARSTYISGEDCAMALFSSISFDLTITSMFLPLISGNILHVYGQEMQSTLIERVIRDGYAKLVKLTPSHLKLLQESNVDLRAVKAFIVGGEQFDTALAASISSRGSGTLHIYNEYGPTEATVGCVLYRYQPGAGDDRAGVLIGKPAPNNEIYILNDQLQLLPRGVAGELYIGGSQLFAGYISAADQTGARLINNPFASGKRIYKTGDRARWLPDGNIEFLGRLDDQVKIRGFRIELGEIEKQLMQHPAVKEAVVLAHEREGLQYLTGYYVSDTRLDAAMLRDHLSASLPEYMVPAYYVQIASKPLTPNGKVNRKALPDPELAKQEDYLAPETKEEKMLASIWAKVLGLERIGITDDFFSIGGDSIRSIQICSRLKAEGYKLTVKDIITHKTIRAISPLLQKQKTVEKEETVVMGGVLLTGIQQWFFEHHEVHRHHYNQSVVLDFPARITKEELAQLFRRIAAHHDALRMVFRRSASGIVQYNQGPGQDLPVLYKDLRGEASAAEVFLQCSNELQGSIDLEQGPLLKLGLFDLEAGSRLLVVIHHLVVDAISWRILFEDIDSLYKQMKAGIPLQLPQKTDAFKTWSEQLQSMYVRSSRYKKGIEYWRSALHTSHLLPLPAAASKTMGDAVTSGFRLSRELTDKLLGAVHKTFHTQINDLLLAGFLLTVNEHYGKGALLLHLEGHGREEVLEGADVSRTVGWFTSLFPVVLEYAGKELSGLIHSVKESLRGVPNNGIDYLIGRYVTGELPSGHRAQVLFNYLGQFDSDTEKRAFFITGEPGGTAVSPASTRAYDWEVNALVTGGQLQLDITYDRPLDDFMTSYASNLEALINYCLAYGKQELSPSDLTYKKLGVAALQELQSSYDIKDVYPLSPMQEGLLFHSVADAAADHYFLQVSYRVQGALNIAFVERSLQELVQRYDILRTIFLHAGYERALQVVLVNSRAGSFTYADARDEVNAIGLGAAMDKYRAKDKAQKFILSKDVLLRLTVYRLGEEEYGFIWSFHHILMDGWCMSILVQEFNAYYRGLLSGENVTLGVVHPYSGYISWLEERDKERSLSYWREYLAGYAQQAVLPQAKTRSVEEFKLVRTRLIVSREQTALLRQRSRGYGVTLNTMLQTAWAILLGRYNNSTDVVFGAVVSGRPAELPGIEQMVGLFINTIPVRIHYNEAETVLSLLKRVQERAVDGEPHHYNQLTEIQSVSELPALFDHIMVFENYPVVENLQQALYTVTDVQVVEQSNYDLSLIIDPAEELSIEFNYNSNKYTAGTIQRLMDHLSRIISQMAGDMEQPIGAIDMLTTANRRELLETFNATTFPYQPNKTVLDLFDEQVKQRPGQVAVRYLNRQLSYRELDERSGQLAAQLARAGVRPGELVGILQEPTELLLVSILGVLKVGATFVPIDKDYPEARKKHIVSHSGISVLIYNNALLPDNRYISTLLSAERLLDITSMAFDTPVKQNDLPRVSPDKLAYVLYTSGSTGLPKGVMISHGALFNYLSWASTTYLKGPDGAMALFSSISFDLTITSMFLPLISGHTLYVYEQALQSTLIEKVVKDGYAKVVKLTPSHLKLLMESNADLSGIRVLIVGGEQFEPDLAACVKARGSDALEIYNEYGPTEATVGCVIYQYDGARMLIGKPAANNQIYILNEQLQLLPHGVAGELFIGGAQLFSGYISDAAQTAARLMANPYAPGQLMYKTGDQARWLEDGNIELLGRLDDQVKIRGFRIELGEITSRLKQHPAVKDAVVVACEKDGSQYLAGYYVSASILNGKELRDHLLASLPEYMLPTYFIPINSIPLTQNGKVDRKALPDAEPVSEAEHITPRNEVEVQLAGIWSDLLKLDPAAISLNKSFYELGGDSIKALKLIVTINRQFNVNLKMADLLSRNQLGELADHLLMIRQVNVMADDLGEVVKIEI